MLNFIVIRLQIFLQIHIFTNITKNSKDEGLISTQSWILCSSWKTRTEHKVGDEKKGKNTMINRGKVIGPFAEVKNKYGFVLTLAREQQKLGEQYVLRLLEKIRSELVS